MGDYLLKAKSLFEGWNNLNVVYCHWKSNEHLIEGLRGDTDLDILVDPDQKEIAEDSLLSCGYRKYHPQYGSRYPGVDEWIGFDYDSGRLIHVHQHYRIVTGHKGMKEYDLPWANLALRTRILDEATGVYIMAPSLELMTLYTRIGLKASIRRVRQAKSNFFRLGEDDKAEISYLKARIDRSELENIVHQVYGDNAEALLEIIDSEVIDSEVFLKLADITKKVAASYRPHGEIVSTLQKYYYAIALRTIDFFKNRLGWNIISRKVPETGKGIMVAFIGQDGAGKSTVTSEVKNWLTWKIEAKKFYLGSGEHYHSWQKKFHDKLPKQKNAITAPISAWLTLSDYVALAKSTLKTIRRASTYAEKGGVAIFDRYPQVTYAGINDGPKIRVNYLPQISNSLVKAYALWCAEREEKYLKKAVAVSPDVVIKLVLPPEESIRRKPEESIDVVSKKHEIIMNLQYVCSTVVTVDATEEYAEEIKRIKRLLWEQM